MGCSADHPNLPSINPNGKARVVEDVPKPDTSRINVANFQRDNAYYRGY